MSTLRVRRRAWVAVAATLAVSVLGSAAAATAADSTTPATPAGAGTGVGTGAVVPAVGVCAAGTTPAEQSVLGRPAGISSCQIAAIDRVPDAAGHTWTEATVALSGTARGYLPTGGAPRADLADDPADIFPQFGITSWAPGSTTYSGAGPAAGNGLSVLFPNNRADWNGQIFVVAPGQSNVPPIGTLVARTGDGADLGEFANTWASLLMDKGFAVVYLRRQAANGLTGIRDADGGGQDTSINDSVSTEVAWVRTGDTLIEHAEGADATWQFSDGHSSGNMLGNLLRESGLNTGKYHGHLVDGMVADDPAGGLTLPLHIAQGQVLGVRHGQVTWPAGSTLTPAQQRQLVPELTDEHTEYLAEHTWLPTVNYLQLKRTAAAIPDPLNRHYEITGVSHESNTDPGSQTTLDIAGVMSAEVDNLVAWVEHGVTPPASVGDLSGGGAQPAPRDAINLPPIACPTGARYPSSFGAATTAYARYDGTSAEPVDAGGQLVDLNRDGVRDRMPTIDTVWQGLHLIGRGQKVTQAAMVACVRSDVTTLVHQRLLDPTVGAAYIRQAGQFPHVGW